AVARAFGELSGLAVRGFLDRGIEQAYRAPRLVNAFHHLRSTRCVSAHFRHLSARQQTPDAVEGQHAHDRRGGITPVFGRDVVAACSDKLQGTATRQNDETAAAVMPLEEESRELPRITGNDAHRFV